MAANKDKITAADIFDQGIKGSYEQFILLNKQAAKSVTDLKREIIKMNNAMKKGGSTLSNRKAVTTATNKQTVATKKLTKQTQLLNQQKTKLNASRKTEMGSIKSLLGAGGIATLILQLRRLTLSYYNNAKALDSMNLAMRSVTDDAYELSRAKEYLGKITERLGLNLLTTSKRYATFLKAARQSNLTMKEANNIFETFANIGANLGLAVDDMGSIFLALEQMLSKGKVSTEELRRQLGEKLPGAMGIMADALGVTTGELDKMLRKGEVLSEEAMPKFAEQARKAFSIDLTERVETLAAAQNRLTNSWLQLVESTSQGGVNSVLIKALDTITKIVRETEVWIELMGAQGVGLDAPGSAVAGAVDATAGGIVKGINELVKLMPQASLFLIQARHLVNDVKSDLPTSQQIRDAIQKRDDDRRRVLAQEKLQTLTVDVNREFGKQIFQEKTLSELSELSIEQLDDEIDKRQKIIIEINKQKVALEEKAKKEAELFKKLKALNPLDRDSIPETAGLAVNEYVEAMEKESKKLAVKISDIRDRLRVYPGDEEAKAELKKVLETYQEFLSEISRINSGGSTGFQAVEILKRSPTYTPPENEKKTQSYFTKKDDDTTGLQATAANINKSLEIAQEAYGYIADLENAQFERRMEQLEEETNAINEKYDTLERLALGDEELTAKLAIRREEALELQAKKEKKLEYEAAKAKKKQSLIDAALNIALGITSALTAPPPANWIGAGVAAALGAVQLATIAATPLPAYADGTDNHPGGLAMLGDGGKNEIALHPDGTVYMSGDTPEVVDMPKGSKVMSDAKDYINQQVIKAIIDTDNKIDEIIVDKITEAVHKGFKSVKINNNNINNNNLDFQMWRYTLLNGNR